MKNLNNEVVIQARTSSKKLQKKSLIRYILNNRK